MNKLINIGSEIKNKLSAFIVLLAVFQLIGCASTVEKDANKNIFQQALILQGNTTTVQSKNKIEWQFSALQIEPDSTQKHELFLWFSTLEDFSNTPILLQLGPDWVSSYKRGNALRKMIPRGILIQQKYDDQLPKHSVIFTLKNNTALLNKKEGL